MFRINDRPAWKQLKWVDRAASLREPVGRRRFDAYAAYHQAREYHHKSIQTIRLHGAIASHELPGIPMPIEASSLELTRTISPRPCNADGA